MKKNHLLAKWLNDDLSEDELKAFEASADFEKYKKIKKYTAHLTVDSFNEDDMLSNILKQKKKKPKAIPLYRTWFFRAAAIFVLALGIMFAIRMLIPQTETADLAEKTAFSLPDHSEVVLNSGSEIQYKKWNWNKNRHLELEGEAYFKVAKGRRFEVQTKLGTVAVLGTQFNVKARKNRFDVICYEGRVKVNYADKEILLTHGQAVSFENGNQIKRETASLRPEWITNQICFYKENIRTILDEVERQYNITIELKTQDTVSLFTGKLPAKNLDTALQIISTTYNLKIEKVSNNKIIIDKK